MTEKSKPEIEISIADTSETSFVEVFEMLLALHAEGGYAPLDGDKAMTACYTMLKDGMTFVAKIEGNPVGVLVLGERKFWYSESSFLQEVAFFVRPEYRGGMVGIKLMRAAKALADVKGKICFITVNNPDRRTKKTTASIACQVAGYVPLGFTMKIA